MELRTTKCEVRTFGLRTSDFALPEAFGLRTSHFGLLFTVCCLFCASLSAQWLETMIPLPDTFIGVGDPLCVAYYPGTNQIFVGGDGSYVVVVDGATNQKVARIPMPDGVASFCLDSRRSRLYCSNYATGVVFVIDCTNDSLVRTITVDSTTQNALGLTLDSTGALYCSDADERTVFVIRDDTISAAVRVSLGPQAICYNFRNNKVYVADYDYRLVSVIAHDSLFGNIIVQYGPKALLYNPTSNKVYCACNFDTVIVIDGQTDTVQTIISLPGEAFGLGWNSKRNKVYCASMYNDTGAIAVVDGITNAVVAQVPAVSFPGSIVYNPTTDLAYCGSIGGAGITVIDGDRDTVVRTVSSASGPLSLAVDPSANRIYVVSRSTARLSILDGVDDSVLGNRALISKLNSVCYNSVRNRVYFSNEVGNQVYVADASTNMVIKTLTLPFTPGLLAYNFVSDKVYCASTSSNNVGVIGGGTDSVLTVLATGGSPIALCFSPTSNKVYCANQSTNSISVIDGAKDSVTSTIPATRTPTALCWNPNRNWVYCGGRGTPSDLDSVFATDCATDTIVGRAQASDVSALCYDARNDQVYCAMRGENAVKVLDGNADSTIAGVTVGDEPSALCINPIDNLAYCANSGDRSVSVIDVATHRVVATLRTLRYPSLLSFDSLNDKVYCAGQSWSVSVIYGPWNSVVATIPLAGLPTSLCLNQAENRTYVALYSGIGVAVLRDSMSSVEEGQTLEERRLSFQAWPTVCRGVLHLRMAAQTAGSRPSQVAVHDITGRLVNLKELPTGVPELELNLADLANGIYFVSPVIPGHTGPRIKIILNR